MSLPSPVPLPTRSSRVSLTVGDNHIVRLWLPYHRQDMLFVGTPVADRSRRRTEEYVQAQHVILKTHIADVFQAMHAVAGACKDPKNQTIKIVKAAMQDKFVVRLIDNLIATVADMVQVHALVTELDVASCGLSAVESGGTSSGKRKREGDATQHDSPSKRQAQASASVGRLPVPKVNSVGKKQSELPVPSSADLDSLAKRDCAFLALVARRGHLLKQLDDFIPVVKNIKERPFPQLVSNLKEALEDFEEAICPFSRYNSASGTGFKLIKGGQAASIIVPKTKPGPSTPTKAAPGKGSASVSPAKASPSKSTPDKASPAKVNSSKVGPSKVNTDKVTADKGSPSKFSPSKGTQDKVSPAKASVSKVSPRKDTNAKVSPAKVPTEVNPFKVVPTKIASAKVDPDEEKPAELAPVKVGPVKDESAAGSPEVATPEDSSSELDTADASSAEVDSVEVSPSEVGSAEVGLATVDPAELNPAKADSTEVSTSEVDRTDVSSAEVDATVDPTEVSAEVGPATVGPTA